LRLSEDDAISVYAAAGQNNESVGSMIMAAIFEKDLATHNEKLPEFFVLVKGDKIEGIFDTYSDALKIGCVRFKLDTFSVKEIARAVQILHFTRDVVSACQ
jgi:hypothetical protein